MYSKIIFIYNKIKSFFKQPQLIESGSIVKFKEIFQYGHIVHQGVLHFHDDNEHVYIECDGYTLCSISLQNLKNNLITS